MPPTPRPSEPTDAPWQLLPVGAVASVFAQADELLGSVGVAVLDDDESLDRLEAAGATIADRRVRWTLGAAKEVLATPPPTFVLHGREKSTCV